TVSGEAPLVDTRSARAQTQYAAETLEALPGNGRLSTLIAVLPGAVLNNEGDRASGALSDRSQTRFAIHGAPNAQPVIDGMNTEMAAANTGVFVFNGVTFQEVVAETTGIGADRDTGGVHLLEQAAPAGEPALRAGLQPAREQQRLLSRLQPAPDTAGDREEQDRRRWIVPAQLQLRLRAVPSAGRFAGHTGSGDRARIR